MASFCSLLFRPAGTFYTMAIGRLISLTPPSPPFVSHISAEDLLLSTDLQKHMPILFYLINVLHLHLFCNIQHSLLLFPHLDTFFLNFTDKQCGVFLYDWRYSFSFSSRPALPTAPDSEHTCYPSFFIFLELLLWLCFYWCHFPHCFLF